MEKHGMSGTQEWRAWVNIKKRCYNPNEKNFRNYGARGIKLCERWSGSFKNFYKDMGPKPSSSHSIDRIDNDGDYTPENCRWATQEEQCNNTRTNRIIEFKGQRKTVSQWQKHFGLGRDSIRSRLDVMGWSVEEALTRPAGGKRPQKSRMLEALGKTQTLAEWSRESGISESTLASRLKQGWSSHRAVTEKVQFGPRPKK